MADLMTLLEDDDVAMAKFTTVMAELLHKGTVKTVCDIFYRCQKVGSILLESAQKLNYLLTPQTRIISNEASSKIKFS
eukprot:COSAG02_NODE_101_length_36804_cov_125.342951_3_plen_78_part_00